MIKDVSENVVLYANFASPLIDCWKYDNGLICMTLGFERVENSWPPIGGGLFQVQSLTKMLGMNLKS